MGGVEGSKGRRVEGAVRDRYIALVTLVSRPVTERVSNTAALMMMGIFRANANPINSSVWHLMKLASER